MKRIVYLVAASAICFTSCARENAGARKISVEAIDSSEDHAGPWEVFGPAEGPDWKWKLTLDLQDAATLKSITSICNIPGEGWSTSSDTLFNKTLYPLVAFYNGKQINTNYDQELGTYPPGKHVLELYGQKGVTPFAGSLVLIVFRDGTMVSAKARALPFGAQDEPVCSEQVPFDAGREWQTVEGVWTGRWIRRGNTNLFDATWTSTLGESKDELVLERVEGYRVTIYRKGTKGYYHGLLSCDKKEITDGTGDWFANGERWSAQILP